MPIETGNSSDELSEDNLNAAVDMNDLGDSVEEEFEECDDVPDEDEGMRKPSMLDGLREDDQANEGSFGSPIGGSP